MVCTTSHSTGPGFNIRQVTDYPNSFFTVFLSPSKQIPDLCINEGHICFLSNYLLIHRPITFDATQPGDLTTPLLKPQINAIRREPVRMTKFTIYPKLATLFNILRCKCIRGRNLLHIQSCKIASHTQTKEQKTLFIILAFSTPNLQNIQLRTSSICTQILKLSKLLIARGT
jgi:hypothetical protein